MTQGPAWAAAAVLAGAVLVSAQPQAGRSVRDGVYTEAQARRGEQVFKTECSYCHQDDLSGGFFDNGVGRAPALAGARAFGSSFGERWNNATVGEMVATIAAAMPQQKPASLTLQQYVDIVSFLLSKNEIPPGPSELPTDIDTLGNVLITSKK
jgi:cytochrome c